MDVPPANEMRPRAGSKETVMRIGIKVNRDVALAAGHDSYGIVAFEIPASRLSESQRAALIAYGSIDWAGRTWSGYFV